MLVQKSVKLRIYPNNQQDVVLLEKHFGCRRWVYNHFLNLFNKNYHQGKKKLSYIEASKILTDLKKETETEWLKEVNSQTLQASIKDLDGAYDRFTIISCVPSGLIINHLLLFASSALFF